jgi:hypothetical protein
MPLRLVRFHLVLLLDMDSIGCVDASSVPCPYLLDLFLFGRAPKT